MSHRGPMRGCPVVTFTPADLPLMTRDIPYSEVLTPAGGTAPYTFRTTSGTLPTGLTLSSGGTLSGTPTVVATFTFEIEATDARGCRGSQSYTETVLFPS